MAEWGPQDDTFISPTALDGSLDELGRALKTRSVAIRAAETFTPFMPEPVPPRGPTDQEICMVIAQAICRDCSRIRGCHCQGDDARCRAARIHASRAAIIFQALRSRGFL